MQNNDQLENAIRAAQKASEAASPEMKEKAFEVVLAHLLAGVSQSPQKPQQSNNGIVANPSAPSQGVFDASRVATQLGIPADQVSELYEMKGDVLHVAIKPVGKGIAEKQRCLAYALAVGYRFGLGIKEVSIAAFSEAADEWGVRDTNLGRNLKEDKNLQAKGVSKGKKPLYSLAPGAAERIREDILSLFG